VTTSCINGTGTGSCTLECVIIDRLVCFLEALYTVYYVCLIFIELLCGMAVRILSFGIRANERSEHVWNVMVDNNATYLAWFHRLQRSVV
jgi:hypothetical protein